MALGDLEGLNSHLLVTTHEYLPVPVESGAGWAWEAKAGGKWSYMTGEIAPKVSQEVNGGSLFAYRIPRTWRKRSDGICIYIGMYIGICYICI